jgi:metal-sulfur cluster biosynthetic enzyme
MTLTAPNCPVAGSLPGDVRNKVAAVPGVTKADVELVWEPPWDKSRLSEEAQLELGRQRQLQLQIAICRKIKGK